MTTITTGLAISRIGDRTQLSALEPEWDRLLERTDVGSPFLTPGWQSAWLDTYGKDHELWVLTARDGQELVGLWPLGVRRRGMFRILEPLSAGRSDWLDLPVVQDRRQTVLASFFAYLSTHRREWDLLELRDMLTDSPTIGVFEELCRVGRVRLQRQPRTVSPYLALEGTWEQFLQAKRPKFRSNLKYYRRLPERDGRKLDIRRISWTDEADAVTVLSEIERRSWKARDGNIKVSTPIGEEFYRRFCAYFAERGFLEVWRAELDGVPMAFVLNIIYGGKVYHYNTSYDETAAAWSPGLLLHSEAISDAYDRGLSEYDFLSGDEPYKERWCSHRRDIAHLAFSHRGLRSRAAFAVLVQVRWALRRSPIVKRVRERLFALVRRMLRAGKTST